MAFGTVGGGVWQELNTGRSCGVAGIFFPARQLHTGETGMRQVRLEEVDPRAHWTIASDAGKRVAEEYGSRTNHTAIMRSREQVAEFFGDLELVDPGLVWLPQWRPGAGDFVDEAPRSRGLAGVARTR